MTQTKTIQVSPPAKINLYLDVVGRRDDGYHELETVFLPLPGLCDEIEVCLTETRQGISLECDTPELPTDSENLCVKAAEKFAKFANSALPEGLGVEIRLQKRIPVAAGLGGGSSDAAAVLLALNQLCADPLSDSQLSGIAVKLGADVPFFLNPVPSVARGIGEILTPLEVGEWGPAVVLANPLVPISSVWAYGQLTPKDYGQKGGIERVVEAIAGESVSGLAKACYNVFDRFVCRKFPLCAMIKERMMDSGAPLAMVSGSGPTVFGICEDLEDASKIAVGLREFFGDAIWICVLDR